MVLRIWLWGSAHRPPGYNTLVSPRLTVLYSGVSLTHSGRLFQSGPAEFPPAWLLHQRPLSFHTHRGNVRQVYQDWLQH